MVRSLTFCALLSALFVGVAGGHVALEPAQAPACTQERAAVKKFQRTMAAKRRTYYRKHASRKKRRAFVRRQKAQLKLRKRRLARCLKPPPVTPGPAPVVPAPAPGTPAPAPGSPGPVPTTPAPNPSPPAVDALEDVVSAAAEVPPGEITVEGGVRYVRTQLVLDLAPAATRADLDALLARLNATIVSSLKGVGLPTVRIPDPGSLAALRELAASLAGDPGLERAEIVSLAPVAELPAGATGPEQVDLLVPQLAMKSAAAWNARSALGDPPTLVLADFFAGGPPDPALLGATVSPSDFSTPASPFLPSQPDHSHGYLVLGLAAGRFEPASTAVDAGADLVTGAWAGEGLPLEVVDLHAGIARSVQYDRMLLAIAAAPGNVILSTSLQHYCSDPSGSRACTADEMGELALGWVERVRGLGLEDKFLHVTAAGNMQSGVPAATDAALGSEYNAATGLVLPGDAENLDNVVVVENVEVSASGENGATVVLCRADSSKRGGHISASGVGVFSLNSSSTAAFEQGGGTSSATPQVAGIAASMWSLRPGLSPQDVARLLRQSAQPVTAPGGSPTCNTAPFPAPPLDAYAALLATDTAVSAPAMAAVLDVDTTGQAPGQTRFDEHDIDAFVEAFADAGGAVDYGRYDLNGDGRTGAGTARLDLDPTGTPAWSLVEREVAGLPLSFDENALTDRAVLCYAAHGPLYQGDAAARDLFADLRCRPPIAIGASMPTTIQPGQPITLSVGAVRTDRNAPQRGVEIELTVTGGTAAPLAGFTDAGGGFSAQVSLGAQSSRVDVTVTARVNGNVIDTETLTAAAPSSGTATKTSGSGSASAFAMANGSGQTDADVAPPGATSFSGSAQATRSEEADSASGAGSTDWAETFDAGKLTGTRVVIGNSATSTGGSKAQGEGAGGYLLRFTVGTGGIPYDIGGSISAFGSLGERCDVSRSHLHLFRFTPAPAGFVHDLCAENESLPVDFSGSLPAGTYEFYVDAVGNTGQGTSASASADVTLALGQASIDPQ